MSTLTNLPILPLRGTVLFPGTAFPVSVGRPESLKAIQKAMSGDQRVLALSQRDDADEVTPENLFTVGTIARIEHVQGATVGVNLLLQGESRGVAVRLREADDHLEAVVREMEDVPAVQPDDPVFLALHREVRDRANELGHKVGMPSEIVDQIVGTAEDPGYLADVVAAYADGPIRDRQDLLETASVEERLRRVLILVQRQLTVLDAQADIQSKVQEELGDRQRQAVLREQLRAIRAELGEDDGGQGTGLRDRLDALELPEAARTEVDRELSRLERLDRDSMEGQVVRTFLETVAELPWSERSTESHDLAEAARILEEDHYGLQSVKDRVLEFLAVRGLKGRRNDEPTRAPTLLFVGPPGLGKTSIAKSIARAMGREYVRVSLGGARDQADITGHRRTYVGALPGRIIQGMKEAGTKNPVFLLDEVDKLGVSYQGDPSAALLEVLDPAQNDTFTDHYLGIPFDLSEVVFIATANEAWRIPAPLRDRMEIVEFSGYTEDEKLAIAKRYLLPRQLREAGLSEDEVRVQDDALAEVIRSYTREAGVRRLEREIGTLVRKAARRIASGEAETVELGRDATTEMLGRPRVHPERAETEDMLGMATGMYYTPAGGDIMFVEAAAMPGSGRLVLTGQLGDVMQESAQAAWTYARRHARALHIPDDAFQNDLHVHVPAGAVPKDGPSAGITMATAIISSLANRRVRPDVAMTGEITLSGRVLPIGGVKEKILGGVRAGVREFLLPKENAADLEDVPADVRDTIQVHLVAELGDVLAHTLRGVEFADGRLLFDGEDPANVEPLRLVS